MRLNRCLLVVTVFVLLTACSYFRDPLQKELQDTQALAMLLFVDPPSGGSIDEEWVDNASTESVVPLENLWASLSNMPLKLQYGESVTVNGRIYSIGSYNNGLYRGRCPAELYLPMAAYSPDDGSWQVSLPALDRSQVAAVERNGLIFIFGGEHKRAYVYSSYSLCGVETTLFNTVQVFNPVTRTIVSRSAMPNKRTGATAAVVNGKVYLIGGNHLKLVEEYDPDLETWTRKSDMPTGRRDAVAAVVNNKIYVIGGNKSPYNQVEEYDPATDTWAAKAPMSTGRYHATAQVVNNRIFVFGGYPNKPYNHVQEYNPATNTWTVRAVMPTGRYGAFSGVHNDQIYVLGGSASVIESFDPSANTWTEFRSDLWTARAYHSATMVDGKVFVFGGYNGSYLSSVEALDPQTLSWSGRTAMPTARRYHASVELGGKVYLIGGHNAGGTLSTVDVYDPVTDSYSSAAPLQVGRQSHAACTRDGRIYVFGGNTNGTAATALNSVEEYDPATNTWVFRRSMSDYRTHMICVPEGNRIFLTGGMNSAGTALSTTESYDFRFDVWSIHQAMKFPRYHHSLVYMRGRIYGMGGRDSTVLSSVEKFDSALEQWIPENAMTVSRQGAAAVATDANIYVVGGYTGSTYLRSTDVFY